MAHDDTCFGSDSTYWEKVARSMWGAYITDIHMQAILKAHDLSGKPTTALEIGAEGGRWSKLLTELGWSMICTDTDEKALSICKRRLPTSKCILVRSDENRLPCESDSVSMLLCMEVGPVIQSDWFMSEASRVLQNDGLIVGVCYNLLSFRGIWVHARSYFDGRYDYYYNRFYLSWKKKLLCSGFSIIYEEGYCWFPFKRDSNSVLIPIFIGLEKRLGLRKLACISPWIVVIAQKSSKKDICELPVDVLGSPA